MDNEMAGRLRMLEKNYKALKLVVISFISLLTIGIISFSFSRNEEFNIIRAKGIVIEDNNGKDRILIGAPVPFSKDRVRTDTLLVRKHWASRFKNPEQYMQWYKNYSHRADGIVVMNQDGFDRVQFGDSLSDANTGKRMFQMAGIVWNDQQGWERGGAGVNTLTNGKSRAVIGLDDSEGEAVHLVTLEEGTKGLMIRGKNGSFLIGMSSKDGEWFRNKTEFTGIRFFNNKDSLVWQQQMNMEK